MPDIIRDWNTWWMDFWSAHPVIFWIAAAAAVALTLIGKRFTR